MEDKLLNWEDGVYRLSFANPEAPRTPTSVVRVDKGNSPVDGKLWATILFEGIAD